MSGILGRAAWTVVAPPAGKATLEELDQTACSFATAKVPAADIVSVHELEVLGFRWIETALTLDAELAGADSPLARFARPADREAVERIAGSAFRFSRFHLDPRLPRELAHKVKAAWAGNWFAGGRGDGMVVAEDRGALAGFLQLRWAPEARLVIDLIAVGEGHERKGLARAMIRHAALHGTGDGRRPRGMLAGTQAANVPSMRLYESLGFRLREAKVVLHRHGGRA